MTRLTKKLTGVGQSRVRSVPSAFSDTQSALDPVCQVEGTLTSPLRDGLADGTATGSWGELRLPRAAYLPINRCNLPAHILGGLTFQAMPSPLSLDGVEEFHHRLFREHLPPLVDSVPRAERFMDYIDVAFRLFKLEEVGWDPAGPRKRTKATYLQLIRGWGADSNGREGAVLKGWVESRFGLRPRYHGGPLHDTGSAAYQAYMDQRTRGLFATNALETQLDLLYAFCQLELQRRFAGQSHLTLYRGIERIDERDIVVSRNRRQHVMLLNNLSSFTAERERAEEFGYFILETRVPIPKVLFYNKLIPRILSGEDEYMVIGGLYETTLSKY